MFNKLLPNKYYHKCPDYQGFSLIDVKPNEAFVEPVRAANRLRKGLAMLIYAQQWFVQALGEASVDIYTKDIANNVTKILEILGDANAIWNSKGERMRPVHVLLDLFGAVYMRLNDLQNDIKALAGQSIRVAQDKTTRQMIKKDVCGIKSSLKDILAVMESMPRYKSAVKPLANNRKQRGFPKIEFSDESETDEDFTDAKFGILLANASSEELNDLRRQAERTRIRSRRRSHLYSVGTEESEDEADAEAQHALFEAAMTDEPAPPQLSLPDSALHRLSGAARVKSSYRSCSDGSIVEHERSSSLSAKSIPSLSALSEHGETLEFPSCPQKFFLTKQRPSSIHATLPSVELTIGQAIKEERRHGFAISSSLASPPVSCEIQARTSQKNESSMARDRTTGGRSSSCTTADEEAIDPYYLDSEYSDLDDEIDPNHRGSHAVYTTATKVLMSRSVVQERPYCRPVVLQKTRKSLCRQHRVSETRLRSFRKEDFMTDSFGNFDSSDVESSIRSSMPDSGIFSGSDSMSSTQTSPIVPSNRFADMLVLPELIAVHSDDESDEESSWMMDVTGLLCLDKSKVYSLAKVAELQQHFGPRLEKVVIKTGKDELASKFRLTTEISYDGQVWRVRQ
ncbi:protein of unknown function [Taphrina deformans PYCC 5710]|uniref:Uncharacterized protein n=1 Tax=Taphrina deformans (strain PYCC 5710 / ATCC 11124 / CBS 356.35 / IMI 108563 / JCM 9778 / NBRC 8474) TaxID=1097556 RepID=R4XI71_TAPDE|nr:protein of unknown function [Taphrina deformans PYCC 5710]|eukprot:CCG83087.1 protein of unknown function [Taphrina deformans PYCC 5710]